MIKVINVKNYYFGTCFNRFFTGRAFGIIDTETGKFASFDGKMPYVLEKKYIMQSVLDSGNWIDTMKWCEGSTECGI